MFTPYKIGKTLSITLIILLLSASLTSPAQIPSPRHGTYINDMAGVLDKNDIAGLDKQIHALEKKYSVQLAVVLVKSLPAGMSIEDFSRKIGQKWHVGISDSGLVYVAAIDERKQRLEVSNALTERIPDSTAHDITDQIKPFFRNKDYAGGLKGMISDIGDHLQTIDPPAPAAPTPAANTPAEQPAEPSDEKDYTILSFIITLSIGALIWALVVLIFRGVRSPKGSYTPDYRSDSTVYTGETDHSSPYHIHRDTTAATIIAAAGAAAIAGSLLDTTNNPDLPPGSNNDTSGDPGSSGSDFGNWGGGDSGSSDPGFSSSDSGFSDGGSTNDW